MIVKNPAGRVVLAVVVASCFMIYGASAQAAAPVKLVLSSHFGREVNLTEVKAKAGLDLEDTCTIESGDVCQPGKASSLEGGFTFPESVAGAPDGDFFVADNGGHRIEEFDGTGAFVLMFGKEVNATTHGDVCTAASGDTCQAGTEGTAGGQLADPGSVAVDPSSGDIYVAESLFIGNGGQLSLRQRIQKFTSEGQFIYEIGREVNEATKGNLCTAEEESKGVKCVVPAEVSVAINGPGLEHGAIEFPRLQGNVIASGGARDLLYVGSEGSLQQFDADGTWSGEISLPGVTVTGVAVNDNTSNIYTIYGEGETVHSFNEKNEELPSFQARPTESSKEVKIAGIAVDFGEHIAVAGRESIVGKTIEENIREFGLVYNASLGLLLTEFEVTGDAFGISFAGAPTELNTLYIAAGQEVTRYKPEPVAELVTGAASCEAGVEQGTSATLNCTLNGEVNPYDINATETWFEFGRTCQFGSNIPHMQIATAEGLFPVSTVATGLRPNEAFCYELAGTDENLRSSERLTGEMKTVTTPAVPPKIIGQPSVSFVKSNSAVLSGQLNPENANTLYDFDYGPCADLKECSNIESTVVLSSSVYGAITTEIEATGLSPGTTYSYLLTAVNEDGQEAKGCGGTECEGTFTTMPAPAPIVSTGSPSAIGTTSAVMSGSVDPQGQTAVTYRFEAGIYEGAATQYAVVLSGSVGISSTEETAMLSGLQPGLSYAYRITAKRGSEETVGAPVTFTTAGVAMVLTTPISPELLPVPKINFPKGTVAKPLPKCKHGYSRSKDGKCVKDKVTSKKSKKQKTKKHK